MIGYIMFWIGFILISYMVWKWNETVKEEKWEKELNREYEEQTYWYNYFNEEVID